MQSWESGVKAPALQRLPPFQTADFIRVQFAYASVNLDAYVIPPDTINTLGCLNLCQYPSSVIVTSEESKSRPGPGGVLAFNWKAENVFCLHPKIIETDICFGCVFLWYVLYALNRYLPSTPDPFT